MCQPGKHQRCKLINQRSLTLLKTFSRPNQNMCPLNFLNVFLGFYLVFLYPKANPSWVLQPLRPSRERSHSQLVSLSAYPRKHSNRLRLLGELSVMNKMFCDYNMSILVWYLSFGLNIIKTFSTGEKNLNSNKREVFQNSTCFIIKKYLPSENQNYRLQNKQLFKKVKKRLKISEIEMYFDKF